MPATTTKYLNVPLNPEVREELEAQARRVGEPATVLARRAIEDHVRALQREQIADEIAAYAEAMAGTEFDFDPAIEAAGLEVWANDDDDWTEDDAAPAEVATEAAKHDAG